MDAGSISRLILSAGESMLVNGAETYRVEETVERMGLACGAREVEVFVAATGIFMSVVDGAGYTVSRVRRVRRLVTDLDKVSRINDLSRRLSSGAITPGEAREALDSVDKAPQTYSEAARAFSSGIGSVSFALLFGGGLADIIPAFLGGVFVNYLVTRLGRASLSRFIAVLAGGILAAAVGTCANALFYPVHPDPVIVGNVMILVPGVAMTNAIRDVMSGELVAGGSRFLEALVTAVSIAIGVAVWLSLWKGVSA